MSYEQAIEANGVEIYDIKYFGSYQGDWWAYTNIGFIYGCYGSCSGCDAFQAEFGWEEPTKEKLKEFGKSYVECPYTYEEALEKASENLEWDYEAKEMVEWIKSKKEQRLKKASFVLDNWLTIILKYDRMCKTIQKGGKELEKLFKIPEVAEYFKVSRNAVYKWINENKIKTVKTPGGETRITESEVKRIVRG